MCEYFVRVTSDGQIDIIEYNGGVKLFQFMLDQIGCSSIEIVNSLSGDNHLMVVDDSFLLKDPQPAFNAIASYFYSRFAYAILGTVVIGFRGFRDGEPDLVGFTMTDSLRLVSKCKRISSVIKSIKI